ncbi:MAG: hypothetical protein GXP42_02725 [Chloroflexi bacterium]|nr:hypothetical protein [Chloroflexota bacterium]
MLHQVLAEIEAASGPIDLNALGRKLGVQPSALEGMIRFWVRKGRLKVHRVEDGAEGLVCAVQPLCTRGCPGPEQCPLLAATSNTYPVTVGSGSSEKSSTRRG